MSIYESLSEELQYKIALGRHEGAYQSPYAATESSAVRRVEKEHDKANLWRGAYVRDCDKILNSPYYNRLADKTQVFSLYLNDDITRRSLHVQLVSRIARTIGATLGLNTDLLEAISLGHDLGHTPFGHAGEKALDALLSSQTGRHFNHNIQSVRVMDELFPANLTLQTLNGFAAHNGEIEMLHYEPLLLTGNKEQDFKNFDNKIEETMVNPIKNLTWSPCTLEGALMRICDIIAYLGKDRQDGEKMLAESPSEHFVGNALGATNSEIINNLSVNIIENSYGNPYIALDEAHFKALSEAKAHNYSYIYKTETVEKQMKENILPLMDPLYFKLLADVKNGNRESYIFKHHIDKIEENHYRHTLDKPSYLETEPNQIVTDYIASMTDDYFLALFDHLFPEQKGQVEFHGYFN